MAVHTYLKINQSMFLYISFYLPVPVQQTGRGGPGNKIFFQVSKFNKAAVPRKIQYEDVCAPLGNSMLTTKFVDMPVVDKTPCLVDTL